MTEIQELVEEMQHEDNQRKENEEAGAKDADAEGKNGENGAAVDNSDAKSAMALFDKL